MVSWLVNNNHSRDRKDATKLGNLLMNSGHFRHVCDDHILKDEKLFYRWNVTLIFVFLKFFYLKLNNKKL
jgi:hypothetical protein